VSGSPVDDFPYEVVRSRRRRTVGIVVKADGSVRISVPHRFPLAGIHEVVAAKAAWIRQKRQHFLVRHAERQSFRFFDGETVPCLGEQLTLRPQPGDAGSGCERDGNRLVLRLPSMPDEPEFTEQCETLLRGWYMQFAQEYFRQRAAYFAERLGVSPKMVGIKSYRTRWGSCHHDGRVYFNWRLVMAPPHIADYVVVHELCHLLQADHSPAFWRHVAVICPEYRLSRRWLKENGHRLDIH